MMGVAEKVTEVLEQRQAAQLAARRERERDARIAEHRAAQRALEDDERAREQARVDKQRREEAARQAEDLRRAEVKRTVEEQWLAERDRLDRNAEAARDILGEAEGGLHQALLSLDIDKAAVLVGRAQAGERMVAMHERARDLHDHADGRP